MGCTASCRRWCEREGYDIGYVDVVDRPRGTGVSNYGMWDRLWVGILDLAGVWWLIRRKKRVPEVDRRTDSNAHLIYHASRRRLSARRVRRQCSIGASLLGFVAQVMFAMRFVVQWIASERAGSSVVPTAFWMFSIGGGLMLLGYALYRKDPVFIVGQAFGVFVYLRNLQFVLRERRAGRRRR